VLETARVLAMLARLLGGRTLGLFTSLRRMNEVAELLTADLADDSIEVLAPRRAVDDPGSLVDRFRDSPGGGVLLGSRTFWQGIDIPGDDLQAVVIEKLPFEVPTELRRRREARAAEFGQNAFQRYRLGKMLLNLKQMTGRLIRGETDRGIVVIVQARTDRNYFDQLESAFPPGASIRVVDAAQLPELVAELEIGGLDRG
jgi:ATP-dependent DNA helicase DinG